MTSSSGADPRKPLNLKYGSATFLVALASFLMANLAPMIMNVLQTAGLDIVRAGNVLTAAMLIGALVGLATTPLAAGKYRRHLALSGLIIATAAFAAGTFINTGTVLATTLIIGGAALGTAISTSGAAIAAMRDPNRVSASSGLFNRIMITIILAAVPAFGISQYSVWGAFTIISAAALIVAWQLPDAPANAEPAPVTTSLAMGSPRRTVIAGVAILFLFGFWAASEDSIWGLAYDLGANIGASETSISTALSLASAGGIVITLLIAALGAKIGRTTPMIIGLIAGGIIKIWIGYCEDPTLLPILIVAQNTVYMITFVIFVSTAAGLDARGRWSGPLLSAYVFGSSFAPSIGAWLIENTSVQVFGLIVGIFSFVAIIPLVPITRVANAAEKALERSAAARTQQAAKQN